MAAIVTSDIPGMILKVNVQPGDRVSSGDILFVMEAMKMELEVTSSEDGTVAEVSVQPNDVVEAGQTLATLE